MSHLSLYRRFRPDTFEKIVRQEHVVRILKNQIKSDAVGHAYLFTGPRGTGKTSVARIFARAACCEHPVDGSPCGTCPSCLAIAAGSLDVTEIDAASNNGVGEMRDLREKVQYPPVTGKYKVYIIDEVHMLTDAAFNALLKTLEEPPAHALFILATTEPQKIPATILSRCMRLDFKLLPEKDLEAHLRGILRELHKEYDDEAVAAIARAGAGSDRDMLSIAEACIVYSDKLTYAAVCEVLGAADFRETARLAKFMLSGKGGEVLTAAEGILKEGKAVGVLLKDLIELLSRVTVCLLCGDAEKLLSLSRDLYDTVSALASSTSRETVLRATEILVRLENELRFSSSPRISFEAAILRIASPADDLDVSALRTRLDALERELADLKERGMSPIPTSPKAPETAEMAAPKQEIPPKSPEKAPEAPSEGDFPDEEPVFAEAYFSDGPVGAPVPGQESKAAPNREVKQEPKEEPRPAPKAEPKAEPTAEEPKTEPSKGARSAPHMNAEQAYGIFMRNVRKTLRNGVLFTMCSDLSAFYEGTTLVLETESPNVCMALNRADNRKLMESVFLQIGIEDFTVRQRGAAPKVDPVEVLKQNFQDYPIEIK